jgi:hypothetical protein
MCAVKAPKLPNKRASNDDERASCDEADGNSRCEATTDSKIYVNDDEAMDGWRWLVRVVVMIKCDCECGDAGGSGKMKRGVGVGHRKARVGACREGRATCNARKREQAKKVEDTLQAAGKRSSIDCGSGAAKRCAQALVVTMELVVWSGGTYIL